MIPIAQWLWDTCLDKAFCYSLALNLKWRWEEGFLAHGAGQGEVHGSLVLLNNTLQNGNSGSGGTLWYN